MIKVKEIFISVDVETAGPIPGEYSMLSIGACLADDPNNTFSCLLQPISDKADPKALEISGLSLDTLKVTGQNPSDAMSSFNDWLLTVCCGEDIPVLVGFNAPFDWSFINYYFHRFLGKNPFGFSALDIKSMYMGATGCSWLDTRSSKISEHLKPVSRGDHDALHDAQFQAELFSLVRKITGKN